MPQVSAIDLTDLISGVETGGKFPKSSAELAPLLQKHGLDLVSGWYSGTMLDADLESEKAKALPQLTMFRELGAACIVFGETAGTIQNRQDVPLARRRVIDDDAMRTYGRKLTAFAEFCAESGVPLAFHHHMGTVIESEHDIDRLMAATGQAVHLRNMSATPHFTGQMAITNSAPHEFDIARFVLGAEYSSVCAFQPSRSAPGQGIGPVFMVLRTGAGQLVNIEVNNNAGYGYDVRCELVCEHGAIALRAPGHTETHLNLGATTDYAPDWRLRFERAYRLQDLAWLRSIESGVPAGASAWDGYVASYTAERAVEALQGGREVEIRYAEMPAVYGTRG